MNPYINGQLIFNKTSMIDFFFLFFVAKTPTPTFGLEINVGHREARKDPKEELDSQSWG